MLRAGSYSVTSNSHTCTLAGAVMVALPLFNANFTFTGFDVLLVRGSHVVCDKVQMEHVCALSYE
jgi:hypothetical protein